MQDSTGSPVVRHVLSSASKKQLLAVCAFLIVYAIGNHLLPLGSRQTHWWADLFWTVAPLITAIKCFATARQVPDELKAAWRLFGAGCMAWFVGMLFWDYYELVQGVLVPFPSFSDVGYYLFAVFCSFGLFAYRAGRLGVSLTLIEASQLGIFVSCIVLVHLVIFAELLKSIEQPTLYVVSALGYPVVFMAVLVQGAVKLWAKVLVPARIPLAFVVAGIAVHAFTDSFYAYELLGRTYVVGQYYDILWLLGFALIYWGAVRQTELRGEAAAGGQAGVHPELSRLVPIISIALTIGAIAIFRENLNDNSLQQLLWPFLLLLGFLALREWASSQHEARQSEAIRLSEAQLQQLTRLVPVAIFRADMTGQWLYTNERWREITGQAAGAEIGLGWLAVIAKNERNRIQDGWQAAVLSQGDFLTEFRVKNAGRETVYLLLQAMPVRVEGQVTGYVGTVTDITALRKTEQTLQETEANLGKYFTLSPAMISITRRADGVFLEVNDTYCMTAGYSLQELVGKSSVSLGLWGDPAERTRLLEQLQTEESVRGFDFKLCTKHGTMRHVLASFAPIRVADEDCLLGIGLDVTERLHAEAEMRKLSSALEQTADIVMITDRAGVIEYVNPAFEKITGFTAADALGKRPSILSAGLQGADFYRALWETILAGDVFSEVFVNRNKAGERFYEQKTITPLRSATGEITHFVSTGRDISERIRMEERLRFLAHHDALTALPNRAQLIEHLQMVLAEARIHASKAAVLFLDLDRFKYINDTLGHAAGDALLSVMGKRLNKHMRASDAIARFGGDEFVMVMEGIESSDEPIRLAQRVLDTLMEPFLVEGNSLLVTASIGISLFPEDGEDAGTLLKNADAAMYQAKANGGSKYCFYAAEMGERAEQRLSLENGLRLAIERREFVLHYQPQIDVVTGRIVGAEALLRWQHPDKGLVPPDDFVPLLEDTGLIVPVGRWVLETACAQLADWQRQGMDLTLAVNIASQQLQEGALVDVVSGLLAQHEIKAEQLELEITESTLLHHLPVTESSLVALSQLGVRIALDDFGTGYSALSYLQRYPIEVLKIDRSFVRDTPHDEDRCAITRAIVVMAQSLRLNIVAEGVETEEQRDFLQQQGCRVMQGYLFSRPVPLADLDRLLYPAK